jgi:hypothetical protein
MVISSARETFFGTFTNSLSEAHLHDSDSGSGTPAPRMAVIIGQK